MDHLPNKVSFILKKLVWEERCAALFACKHGALAALPENLRPEVVKFLGANFVPEEEEEDNEPEDRQYLDLGDEDSDEDEPDSGEPGDETFDYDEDLPDEEEE